VLGTVRYVGSSSDYTPVRLAGGLNLVPRVQDVLGLLPVDLHHRDAALHEEELSDARPDVACVDLARPTARRDDGLFAMDLEDLRRDRQAHFGNPNSGRSCPPFPL
jgi:hypothetical protein